MNFPSLFIKKYWIWKYSLNILNELKSSEVWGLKFIDFCNLKWLKNVLKNEGDAKSKQAEEKTYGSMMTTYTAVQKAMNKNT